MRSRPLLVVVKQYSEAISHHLSSHRPARSRLIGLCTRLWPPFREPDKCDVISRAYFTSTASCVLHLSVLMEDKGPRGKHGSTAEMRELEEEILKNLGGRIWQHHCLYWPFLLSDGFTYLGWKTQILQQWGCFIKLHICYVFSLVPHPLCLISEQLLGN